MSIRALRLTLAAVTASTAVFLAVSASRATVVFRETFDRANNATFGSNSGPEGSGVWIKNVTTVAAGNPGSLEINSNQALATHNTADAIYQLSMATSAFAAPWPGSNMYSAAPGKITWYVNMQSTLTTPNGIGVNAGGMGFVLGATNTNSGAVGNNGYILYIGNPNTPDPIHLASFTGTGVATPPTLVDIVTGGPAPFDNVGADANYFSYRIEYTPATNLWELFGRDDGASAFGDPEVNTGYVSLGSGVNSTYTSTALPFMGLTGSWRDAGFVSRFDNVVVDVVPEPGTVLLGALGLAGGMMMARRRIAKRYGN